MIDLGFTVGLFLGIGLAILSAWGADGNKAGYKLVLVVLTFIALAVGNPAFSHEYRVTVERWLDADTFDGEMDLSPIPLTVPARFRIMCVNAPESRGKNKSPEGVAMSEMVKGLGIESGRAEIVDQDSFGRYLVYFRPNAWDQSFNRFLYRNGAPLYSRLTRASRAECARRLGLEP